MPVTSVMLKYDESTKCNEVLTIQDFIPGQTLKSITSYGGKLEREVTPDMKAQISDILQLIEKMYKKTGYRAEVDVKLDFDNNRVHFFDFDRQFTYQPDFERTRAYLKNHFGIFVSFASNK